MKLKQVASLVCAAILATSITGCGSSESGSAESTVSKQASVSSEATKPEELKTYSMFTFYGGNSAFKWEQSPVMQELQKRTNVKIDVESNGSNDASSKVALMLSSGDYPDIIYTGDAGNSRNSFIDAGVCLPLDELIENAPNIKKVWGDSINKLKNPADEKVYFIGGTPRNRKGPIIDANQCLLIQYDVLDKTGYPKLKTLDDVYTVLKKYLETNKDVKGTPFIPWGMWADTWGYSITVTNPAQWINGFTDDSDAYVDPKTHNVTFFNATDYFKDYLGFLNKLYNEKMIDKNAFITKNDQYVSLLSSGRVLSMIDGTWDVTSAEAALRKAGMPERCYARFAITKDASVQDRSQLDCESYTRGFSITNKCKDPEGVIKFFDYVASDEGTILVNWGIEGTHYDVVNGVRTLKPEVVEKISKDADYKSAQGLNFVNWGQFGGTEGLFMAQKLDDGDFAAPVDEEVPYRNGDEWTKKVMDKYGIKNWGQMFDMTGETTPYGYAWSIPKNPDSKGSLAVQKIDEYRHAFVPTIVMSKTTDDFNKNWEKFKKALYEDYHVETWEQELTTAIKDRLELWSAK